MLDLSMAPYIEDLDTVEAILIGGILNEADRQFSGRLGIIFRIGDAKTAGAVKYSRMMDDLLVTPDDFSNDLWAEIFGKLQEMHAEGIELTTSALSVRMKFDRVVDESDRTLGCCIDWAKKAADTNFYSTADRDIRQAKSYRKLTDTFAEVSHMGTLRHSVRKAASLIRQTVDEIESREPSKSQIVSLGEVTKGVVEDIAEGKRQETIYAGSDDLSRTMGGGFRRGQMIVLAGRPSMGKSMTAQALGLQIAKRGHGVMMFALEMTQEELAYRALSDLAWSHDRRIPYSRISGRDLSDREQWVIGEAAAKFHGLPFAVVDKSGLSLPDISSAVARQKDRFEAQDRSLDVVIVDQMGLVRPSDRYKGQKVNEVGEISAGLLSMAKDHGVVVVAVHQLNRNTENRENKIPTMADLRDSGNIEQDANACIFVYREFYYLERTPDTPDEVLRSAEHQIELIVAKNRNGPTNRLSLFCDAACNVVRDAA